MLKILQQGIIVRSPLISESRIKKGEIIHIPNKCPFKMELLDEMMKKSALKESEDWKTQQEKKRQKQREKKRKLKLRKEKSDVPPPMELDIDTISEAMKLA